MGLMPKLKLPLKPTVDTTVDMVDMVVDMVDTVVDTVDTVVEDTADLLNLILSLKQKLPLLPSLMLKLKLMLITDMVDTAEDTVDTEDMVDTAVEDTADLLNLILSLKLNPTTVDTMVDTVVDITDMVDTVDTEVMVVMVDTMDKCHLSSQIFMD